MRNNEVGKAKKRNIRCHDVITNKPIRNRFMSKNCTLKLQWGIWRLEVDKKMNFSIFINTNQRRTFLRFHFFDLVHIRVVLRPVRSRRMIHVSRARHRGLSPTTFWDFLNQLLTLANHYLHESCICLLHFTYL